MYAVLAYHYVVPQERQRAEERILTFGQALRGFNGFIDRYTLVDQDDPLKILTVTLWRSREEFEAWQGSDERIRRSEMARGCWSKPTERHCYHVLPEL